MGWRDVPALRKALSNHSLVNYPVQVPIFGDAFIVNEGGRVHGLLAYLVRPAKPMPLAEYAEAKGWSDKKANLEGWLREIETRRGRHSWLPPHMWEILESGGMVSQRDVQAAWLIRSGCLDEHDNVTCDTFSEEHVVIPADKLHPGMMVEFRDEKMNQNFPGKIVDIRGEGKDIIVYMELIEPLPFMDAPEAMEPQFIRPGFYSQQTIKIGYGTYEAIKKAIKARVSKIKLPPGKIEEDKEGRRDGEHYVLKEPMPLSVIEEFCQSYCNEKNYPNAEKRDMALRYCVWQSLMLYIVPIHPEPIRPDHNGGTFLPMPTERAMSLEADLDRLEYDVEDPHGFITGIDG